jgi:hypothetical protein
MILVDTSVWVDFFARGDAALADLMDSGQVLTHPFVIGELALGNFREGDGILRDLASLPAALVAEMDEVLVAIKRLGLEGSGIGYVDAHLICSARLTACRLWTRDKRLAVVASRLGLSHSPTDTPH